MRSCARNSEQLMEEGEYVNCEIYVSSSGRRRSVGASAIHFYVRCEGERRDHHHHSLSLTASTLHCQKVPIAAPVVGGIWKLTLPRGTASRPSASYTETCTRKMRSSASSSVSHRVAHIAVNRLGRRQIEFKVSLSVIGSCPGNNAHDIMRPKVGQHHLERAYVKVRFPVAQ